MAVTSFVPRDRPWVGDHVEGVHEHGRRPRLARGLAVRLAVCVGLAVEALRLRAVPLGADVGPVLAVARPAGGLLRVLVGGRGRALHRRREVKVGGEVERAPRRRAPRGQLQRRALRLVQGVVVRQGEELGAGLLPQWLRRLRGGVVRRGRGLVAVAVQTGTGFHCPFLCCLRWYAAASWAEFAF